MIQRYKKFLRDSNCSVDDLWFDNLSAISYIFKDMGYKSVKSKPIGVFDSGIGGLTVVRALMKQLPNENIVYFGDTARVPYGPKSPQVVREYAAQDTDFLVKHDVKLIVVACNTVSSVALEIVQKHCRVPVIGVIVPGAKAAVITTKKKTYWYHRNSRYN